MLSFIFDSLKSFFSDFVHLPKYIFFRKYLLLPVIIFISWVGVCIISELIINRFDNLKIVTGRLQSHYVEAKRGKKITYTLYLKLFKNSTLYWLPAEAGQIAPITQILNVDDHMILRMPKRGYPGITLGSATCVYDLKANGRTLINGKNRNDGNYLSLAVVILSLIFFIYMHIRYVRKPNVTS